MNQTIFPMPAKYGVGFTSMHKLPNYAIGDKYRYEMVGHYHNYHFTKENYSWPVLDLLSPNYIIDGFSPNLNKELHIGHLRNLAIAKSLSCILGDNTKFVALLGCSLGVKKAALEGWKYWTNFVGYHPEIFYDLTLPQDVVPVRLPNNEEIDEHTLACINDGDKIDLPKVWDGPNGPVNVIRSDGRPLYAFYDLAFAAEVGPTHYVTGHEQKEHFQSLGFGSKHLPIGLILGPDGTKLKSRAGDALLATEALELVRLNLRDVSDNVGKKIAWNILAWNMLHAARETNLKFEVEKWVRSESPGMYVTYTMARIGSALSGCSFARRSNNNLLTEIDVKLLGTASIFNYHLQQAIVKLDPAPIANYLHDLARVLNRAYDQEPIRNGRYEFACAIGGAYATLKLGMQKLGLFPIDTI
jgi:arginyl-tRNA synthetase